MKTRTRKRYKAERQRRWAANNRAKVLVFNYRRNDRRAGRRTDVTPEWVDKHILSKPCHYCGDTENIGADRVNNKKGHLKSNLLPACRRCNRIRSNEFTVEEMLLIGAVLRSLNTN